MWYIFAITDIILKEKNTTEYMLHNSYEQAMTKVGTQYSVTKHVKQICRSY